MRLYQVNKRQLSSWLKRLGRAYTPAGLMRMRGNSNSKKQDAQDAQDAQDGKNKERESGASTEAQGLAAEEEEEEEGAEVSGGGTGSDNGGNNGAMSGSKGVVEEAEAPVSHEFQKLFKFPADMLTGWFAAVSGAGSEAGHTAIKFSSSSSSSNAAPSIDLQRTVAVGPNSHSSWPEQCSAGEECSGLDDQEYAEYMLYSAIGADSSSGSSGSSSGSRFADTSGGPFLSAPLSPLLSPSPSPSPFAVGLSVSGGADADTGADVDTGAGAGADSDAGGLVGECEADEEGTGGMPLALHSEIDGSVVTNEQVHGDS
jgi:hypothetical protein